MFERAFGEMGISYGKRTAVAVPSMRPRGAGKPVLVVIAGLELGRRIDLDSGSADIGRGDEVTLRIDSELVSRRHAMIQRSGRQFIIADLNSTNGTFVNDTKIKTHQLVEGDQIRVGKVVLKYTECEIEAQYHEQILHRANVDGLTGAYNKRYFQELLERAFAEARGSGSPLAIVIFDIDHFKKVNDTWGHAAGDLVLCQVADVVRGQLRATDVLCRVGGEEFALVLANTSGATARGAAEFIRGGIEMAEFVFESTVIPVTVSLGVVELERSDADSGALFKRADERLYEAKRTGRNKVC
jgi:diguanylate cyclase (GGDEF)-like protein